MAQFVTVSYCLVTRSVSTNGAPPAANIAEDPWIEVSDLNPKPVVGDHYNETTNTFTLNHTALSAAQGAQLATLRDTCANYIKNGFFIGQTLPNDVAGPYWYPCKDRDQANVHLAAHAASVQEQAGNTTFLTGIWCAKGEALNALTAWAIRDHSIENTKSAVSAMHQFVANAQFVMKDATDAVLAAMTVNDVNAVVFNPF